MAGLLLCLCGGCTLWSDFDVHECDVDADCETPVGSLRFCNAGHCVDGCRNNRHCLSRDPRSPICSRTGDECLEVTTSGQECYSSSDYDDASMGDLNAGELTVVGAFAPTIRSSTWLTLDLALREFREVRQTPTDSALPPLLLVLCDDGIDAVPAAMNHLVERLAARAIIASFDEGAEATALSSVRNEALLLSPNAAGAGPVTPFQWYLGGDQRTLASTYPPLLDRLVPAIERRLAEQNRLPKVAAIVGPGGAEDMAEVATRQLRVGQVMGEGLIFNDRLRSIRVQEQQRERATTELTTYAPDLVLMFAGGTFGSAPRQERAEMIGRLEEAATSSGGPLPLYVIGPRQANDSYLDVLAASSPSFRARAVVIDAALPGLAELTALRERFIAAYPNRLAGLRSEPAYRVYDALYYLAYASAASREAPRSAASVLEGLALVTDPSGSAVPVGGGSKAIKVAAELLASGKNINVHGMTGSGPFDTAGQLRVAEPAIYCWTDDGVLTQVGRYSQESTTFEILSDTCATELLGNVLN